ncbi:hypothetical protein UM48_004700 [Salmonella enterica subsp. enterica]|nr:hypothetical protein [Salmonella enterica subsp. enterica]
MARYYVSSRTSVSNVLALNLIQWVGSLLVSGATVAVVKHMEKKEAVKAAAPVEPVKPKNPERLEFFNAHSDPISESLFGHINRKNK